MALLEPKFKALILDFDGVVIDSINCSFLMHCFTAQELKLRQPTFDEFRKLWGVGWKEMLQALWPDNWQTVKNAILQSYTPRKYQLVEEAFETIRLLHKKGRALAIVSNRKHNSLLEHLELTEIPPEFFISIQGLQDGIKPKPEIELFAPVMSKLAEAEISPKETVYVGDALVDFQAAKNLSIYFLAFANGVNNRDEFLAAGVKPEFIISHLQEISRFVD